MRPVRQNVFGRPSGNCLAACVASILEQPVWTVPNFILKKNWYLSLCLWLERNHGMTAVRLDLEDGHPNVAWNFYLPSETPVVWTGPSPRGDFLHCIVGTWDGKLLHDPHPDDTFFEGKPAVDVLALVRLP